MAIVFDENGKYVDEKGLVKLDPTKFATGRSQKRQKRACLP